MRRISEPLCLRPYRQAALMLLVVSALWFTEAVASEPTTAIWKEQDLELVYRGNGRMLDRSTVYNCNELGRLVLALLRAVGARADVRIEAKQCVDFASPQTLRILVASPFEATPENIRAATTYDATRRLLAQLRGEPLPTEADLERFPATWQERSLRRVRHMTLEPGDCLLLQAVRDQLFRKLSVRYTSENFRCDPDRAPITVVVEALVSTHASHMRW
jgi:hypothetical protein